jgi:hypothetical protein
MRLTMPTTPKHRQEKIIDIPWHPWCFITLDRKFPIRWLIPGDDHDVSWGHNWAATGLNYES